MKRGIAWGLLAALAVGTRLAAPAQADRKPNILLIVADDLGWGDIGVQGNPDVPTPHIDSLARNGVRFTDGYVSGPVCSPTRAGLLTGRYQQRFGNDFNPGPATSADPESGLALTETTLADRLKAAGYRTGMVGKWHLGYAPKFWPTQRGFEEFFGFLGGAHSYVPQARGDRGNPIMRGVDKVMEPEYLTDAFAREAVDFIGRRKAEPFFLYLPFNAVHAPLQAGPYAERFADIRNQQRRTYAAMLSALDDAIGRVLGALREHRLEEDTLIVFHSDNGGPTRATSSRNGPLRGFKGQVWEGGIRVPFLMQWKGRLPSGKVYEHPVIALDVHPTALAAAGVEARPEWALDGVNLLPHLTGGNTRPPHERLYWRFGERSALRQAEWKLVREGDKAQIFNLREDVGETQDRGAADPDRLRELEAAWDAWNRTLPKARR
jgi:arylsulfatase A-like enzyme